MKGINLVGKRFGKLTVLETLTEKENKTNRCYCICKCDCGKITKTRREQVLSGHTKSCGCLQKEIARKSLTTHKLSRTRIYRIWWNIKRRCEANNQYTYKYYGGRGIKVCEEWLADFMNFYKWAMANGYREELTIDRIDVNGNYEPKNCRWEDMKVQSNNTRKNHFVEYKNEKHTIAEWSRILGLTYDAFRYRIKRNGIKDKCFIPKIDKRENLTYDGKKYRKV